MSSSVTKQPLKAIFTIFTIFKEICHLTLCSVGFLSRKLRQHPSYTHRQAMGVALLRAWFSYVGTVEFKFPLYLEPGKEGERWTIVEPAPTSLYRPPLEHPSIKPSRIGASWFPRRYGGQLKESKELRVVLHFHGGAYVMLGTRDREVETGQKVIAEGLKALAFFPQYRLSSYEDCAFPAALQDAVSAYRHLLDLGIAPSQIVLSGDSAGGNLVLALLRYINQNQDILPLPSSGLLWSPWVDMAADIEEFRANRNNGTDWVPPSIVEWGARVYSAKISRDDPFLSPARHTFRSGVPLFVAAGTNEILYDSIKTFAKDMAAVKGNEIKLLEMDKVPHDVVFAGIPLGFEDEAMDGAKKALDWLEAHGL